MPPVSSEATTEADTPAPYTSGRSSHWAASAAACSRLTGSKQSTAAAPSSISAVSSLHTSGAKPAVSSAVFALSSRRDGPTQPGKASTSSTRPEVGQLPATCWASIRPTASSSVPTKARAPST